MKPSRLALLLFLILALLLAPAAQAQTPEPLSITGTEPTRIEQATGGYLTVYGTGFDAGTVVRLYGHGVLDTQFINTQTLRAYVPAGVSRGSHDIQVIRSDGQKAYKGNAVIIHAPKAPTATPKPPLLLFNQPELVIEQANTEPQALRPGQPFRLHLRIHNRGDYTAANIRIELSDTSLAVPVEGSTLRVIDRLDYGTAVTVTLDLALNQSAPNGYQSLPIAISYTDLIGREYVSQQSVGLQVGTALSAQPRLLLDSYQSTPADIAPGSRFTLALNLRNVGGAAAGQVVATLGGRDGTALTPFALLGSGNVRYLGDIAPDALSVLTLELVVAGDAKAGTYTLPLLLEYTTPDGQPYSETQALTLVVKQPPQLQLSLTEALPVGTVGESFNLLAEVVNIGRTSVNVSNIEVRGQNFEVLSGGDTFWGPVDAGTSASVDATIVPQQSGTQTLEIVVHYLDDFNQPQEAIFPLEMQVEAPLPTPTPLPGDAAPAEDASPSVWDKILHFFKALLGLGG
ncbi:MAG: hypothetical protein D6755_05295 [Anaerolineae bacterium]|nr:MAG: hypothetical protein D6755_05295 [Anaerolineae bacterium]